MSINPIVPTAERMLELLESETPESFRQRCKRLGYGYDPDELRARLINSLQTVISNPTLSNQQMIEAIARGFSIYGSSQ